MTVYLHRALEMPESGFNISEMSGYWSFEDECLYGDDDDDEDSEVRQAHAAVTNDPNGTWMLTCTEHETHWRDAALYGLGNRMNLPNRKSWWEGFWKACQCLDDDDMDSNARLAWLMAQDGGNEDPSNAVSSYEDWSWDCSEQDSEENVYTYYGQNTLDNNSVEEHIACYVDLQGLGRSEADDKVVFKFCGKWYGGGGE